MKIEINGFKYYDPDLCEYVEAKNEVFSINLNNVNHIKKDFRDDRQITSDTSECFPGIMVSFPQENLFLTFSTIEERDKIFDQISNYFEPEGLKFDTEKFYLNPDLKI